MSSNPQKVRIYIFKFELNLLHCPKIQIARACLQYASAASPFCSGDMTVKASWQRRYKCQSEK